MNYKKRLLISEQIATLKKEVVLIKFAYSVALSLSFTVLLLLFRKIYYAPFTDKGENYLKFIEASAAILIPLLTFILQGYCYPRIRKLKSMEHLLTENDYKENEKNIIYDINVSS